MNTYLKENIKLLRKRRKRSQEEVAKSLSITRSAYNSYENGVAEPGIGLLLKLSDFFQINLDKLVKIDLSTLPESQISQLEKGVGLHVPAVKKGGGRGCNKLELRNEPSFNGPQQRGV